MSNDLKAKLQRLKASEEKKSVDWKARKQRWIQSVDSLYQQIDAWLSEYQDEGYLKLETRKTELSEDHLGTYKIDQLTINAGQRSIAVEPVGALIIGALGRVDLYLRGFRSDGRMLLLVSDDKGREYWGLSDVENRARVKELKKETFESVISKWMD